MSLANDKPQATPILEDSSNVGVPLIKALEGDTYAGKAAHGVLNHKNAAGEWRYPKVNDNDEIIVSLESADIACLHDSAKVTGGTTEQQVIEISLVAGNTYRKPSFSCSNFRQTEFRVVYIDDPTGTPAETELFTALVSPNMTSFAHEFSCISFAAPATDPVLRVYGTNKDVASDLRAAISIEELS